jgi:hypothetical protein
VHRLEFVFGRRLVVSLALVHGGDFLGLALESGLILIPHLLKADLQLVEPGMKRKSLGETWFMYLNFNYCRVSKKVASWQFKGHGKPQENL